MRMRNVECGSRNAERGGCKGGIPKAEEKNVLRVAG